MSPRALLDIFVGGRKNNDEDQERTFEDRKKYAKNTLTKR
jgi:hypothetical protein